MDPSYMPSRKSFERAGTGWSRTYYHLANESDSSYFSFLGTNMREFIILDILMLVIC